ncbi:MAG TPA: hypothetical protein VNA04_16510 [Thermoanaerobaculia bacterium]|nr:hypothetical protein [Thermoanaerobaculia bacterium]
MRMCMRHGGLAVMMVFSAAALLAQSPRLNPTVTVLPQATAPVPPECDEVTAPQPVPRPRVAEISPPQRQPPPEPAAAPRPDLRSQLRDAHAAALGRDRDAFQAALAGAKSMLAAAPPGAERNAAADAIAAFDDLAALWDYQFSTPTGAFFDAGAGDGALLRSLTRYRGYEEFIRRQAIVDANGVRYYPTRESSEFLLGIAGERLTRAGVPAGRQVEAPPRTTVPAPPAAERVQPPAPAQPPPATPRVTQERPRTTAPSKPRRTTAARPTAPAPQPSPATATAAGLEPPLPPGIVSTPPVITPPVTETSPAPDTAGFDPMITETAAPEEAEETVPRRARGRSIILPIVLILIGFGVLIVLFRASA